MTALQTALPASPSAGTRESPGSSISTSRGLTNATVSPTAKGQLSKEITPLCLSRKKEVAEAFFAHEVLEALDPLKEWNTGFDVTLLCFRVVSN